MLKPNTVWKTRELRQSLGSYLSDFGHQWAMEYCLWRTNVLSFNISLPATEVALLFAASTRQFAVFLVSLRSPSWKHGLNGKSIAGQKQKSRSLHNPSGSVT